MQEQFLVLREYEETCANGANIFTAFSFSAMWRVTNGGTLIHHPRPHVS